MANGLRGILPLLALALLGGGAGACAATSGLASPHAVLSHADRSWPVVLQAAQAPASATPAVPAPPLSFPAGGPIPVLRQTGSREWETTVLVNDADPGCSGVDPVGLTGARGDDRLARSTRPLTAEAPDLPSRNMWDVVTTEPDTETAGEPVIVEKGPDPSIAMGSACEVTVAFAGMRQVPETAMLVLDQAGASSSIPLTVSRDVTLWYYLGIPAIAGLALALATVIWSVFRVRARFRGSGPAGGQRAGFFDPDLLGRPVVGSGAWTLGDSWATNISTGVVVVGSVLGVTAATSTLFPGVALDRFAIVNIAAGIVVSFAPLIFGICYALYTRNNPGPSADATVIIPVPLGQEDRIEPPHSGPLELAGETPATLPAGATITLRSRGRDKDGGSTPLPDPVQARLPEGAGEVQLPGKTALILTGLESRVMVLPAGAVGCELPMNTAVTLFSGQAYVPAEARADLPPGALVELPSSAKIAVPNEPGVPLTEYVSRQVVEISVVSGAALVALAGATITWPNDSKLTSAEVQAGKTIQVSPGSKLHVPAGVAIALPGGSDIPVPAGSAISLGSKSTLAVAGGDLVPRPGGTSPAGSTQPPPPDLTVTSPACISLPGGAKVTVTGSADIKIPAGTVIASPHYQPTTVRRRRELQVPQASNVITGNLGMALIAAFVTMFGIGAEFSIAGVLAFGLSEASQFWRSVMLIAIVAAGLGVLYYAVTAIAALADPQPGSSLSARSGTSFTL